MDGGTDLGRVLLQAERPPRTKNVPALRGESGRCGRTVAFPRPPPPLAARGSVVRGARGEAVAALGRSEVGVDGEEFEAPVAEGNEVAVSGGVPGVVRDGAEGVAGLVVALEERGSGGAGGGGGKLERKMGLAQAVHPPPKRMAVSVKRQFPPGCGKDAPLQIGGSGEGSLHVECACPPPSGDFTMLDKAVASPSASSGGSEEGGLLLETVPTNADSGVLEKVATIDRGDPMTDSYYHGPEAAVVKSAYGTEDGAGLVVKDMEKAAGSGEFGMNKELVPIAPIPPKRRMVSAKRCFPPGCGRDVVGPHANGGCGVVGLHLEALAAIGGLGALKEVVATDDDGSVAERCAMDIVEATINNALDGAVEVHELEEGEIPTEADYIHRESEVNLTITSLESTAARHECAVPPTVAAGLSMSHFSNEKFHVNALQCNGKSAAWTVAEDAKVMKASSLKVAAEPFAEGPLKPSNLGKSVSESCSMKRASLHTAGGVLGKGTMRSKITFTARKAVRSPVELNLKSVLATLDKPYSMGKGKQYVSPITESLAPIQKLKVKGPAESKHHPTNVASRSSLFSNNKVNDKEAYFVEDDILKALSVNEGKLDLCLNLPSVVPSILHHMQHGDQNADARSKVRMICRRFQLICRSIVQAVEQCSLKVRRVDLAADKLIRKLSGFNKSGPIVGKVPGVEIGDEFLYRVELAIVGLHRPYQGGIDTTKDINDTLIAISIVASGGYPDELSSSGEVIYTGSGGKPAGKKEDEDQKLERGNLALKNCINTKTPVRVIHGFKGQDREQGSHSRAKEMSTFTYDGLYLVLDCWLEGLPGSKVFKYRLHRIPGQPELPLHVAKGLRQSVVRRGLCIADISQGREKIPICVINTIDNACPASFKYICTNKYPSLPSKRSPQGCDCTGGCSNSVSCACVVKNGGRIPFNFNGAVVHAKPLIFECGPSCRCPPSCHNRVSQLGMKMPLEVFRTAKTGWGVRSLRSISSGSFICEYAGELLHGKEANQRMNDEYLFPIGHNYDAGDVRKVLPPTITDLKSSSGPCYLNMEDADGFTIDAAGYGNIGRFINHSCSPNLYAQNVLWDHDDKRMPHVMLFAAENISSLQELTYDYNYEKGHVHDLNGRVKVKYCQCGSPQCRGRLY